MCRGYDLVLLSLDGRGASLQPTPFCEVFWNASVFLRAFGGCDAKNNTLSVCRAYRNLNDCRIVFGTFDEIFR